MPLRTRTLTQSVYTIAKQLFYATILILWWCIGLPVTFPILFVGYILYLLISGGFFLVKCFSKRTPSTRLTLEECMLLDKVGSDAVIQSLFFLSGPIALDRLREKIKSELADESSSAMLQNLTRYLCLNDAPFWCESTDFDVNKHVFLEETAFSSMAGIESYVTKCASEPLELSKPLWEIRTGSYSNEGFLLVRFHPCVMSGRTAVTFLCNKLADSSCIYTSPHCFPEGITLNQVLCNWLSLPLRLISSRRDHVHTKTCRKDYFSKERYFSNACQGNRRCAWSGKIHLPSLKHTVAVMRTSISAIALSALASTFRLIPNNFNDAESFPIKLIYDVSNKAKCKTYETSYSESTIPAPCTIEGAIPCLWALRRSLFSLKESMFPGVGITVTKLMGMFCSLGASLRLLKTPTKENSLCAFTSLSGPTATLYVCGRRVNNICTWYPVTSDVIMTATIMTYADEFRVCIQSWESSGIDSRKMADECKRQIEILIEQLKYRQVPKRKKLYYDDGEVDEFDLTCEDDEETIAHAHSTRSTSRLFFHRTKVHSSNGNINNVAMATVSAKDGAESTHHPVDATEPQDIVFSEINQSPKSKDYDIEAMNSTGLPRLLTTDLEVGIVISPAIERRHSTCLL